MLNTKYPFVLVGAAMLASALLFARDEPAKGRFTLEDLTFMAGHWSSDQGKMTEELWLPPRGEMMIGVNRTSPKKGAGEFEYLRIVARKDGVVYVASPGGKGATEFPLVSIEGKKATFENPTHDFPKRILYERNGDTLKARIEGDGGKSMDWSWKLASKLD